MALTVAALVVPGTAALLYRPQNAREGYVALTLAAVLVCWQIIRMTRLRIRLGEDFVQPLRWRTATHAGRSSHRLMALVEGVERPVCRAAATDQQARDFTVRARAAGLSLTPP